MSYITGITRGGSEWTPAFIIELKEENCIGCGRCFKVCPRKVFDLVEREIEDDEDGDDDTSMVMTIADALDCIGCGSCARVCPKNCHVHEPAAAE